MSNCTPGMTPAAIKYLLVLDDLCREGKGVRSVEIAARMNVSKPSAHSMLQNLCQAGLVEKERYGTVYLTREGRSAAAGYAACFGLCHPGAVPGPAAPAPGPAAGGGINCFCIFQGGNDP